MNEENLYIASVLKEIRINHNMSQKRLALRLGMSSKTISAYEKGRIIPSIAVINKLSRMFGVSFSNDYIKRHADREIQQRFGRLKDALIDIEEMLALNKGLSF